jgi:hypothetical protein
MRRSPRGNRERSFGLSVGGVLCVLAALLFWRHRPLRGEVLGAVGAVLVTLGAVAPGLLRWPSAAWWRFAGALGYINARLLLTVLFLVVLVPVGLIWRIMGKDPLARRRAAWQGWSPYPRRYRDHRHFERMY